MHVSVDELNSEDFMDPYNLLQLADGTNIFAEDAYSFKNKAEQIGEYSRKKYQIINETKTQHLNMTNSNSSNQDDIVIDDNLIIRAVDNNKGYMWLGFWLTNTNNLGELIKFNIKKKMFNVIKFYECMEMNAWK